MRIRYTWTFGLLLASVLCVGTARADAGDVVITVKEMVSGKPMAGVKLSVRSGGPRADYFTGDDGTAAALMPEDAPYATVEASSEGWVPVVQVWNKEGVAGKRPEKFDILMEKAAGISGTLVDETGAPLVGGKVFCVVDKKYPNGQRLGASWTSATVDAAGKWTFAGVPESFDKIQLGAYHKDCLGAQGWYSLEDYTDIVGLKKGTAVLKLTRGTPVTVTVTDKAGKAVRNARVAYGEDRVVSNVYPEEKANAKGVATMGIVAGAQAVITVQAKGHAPELVRVTIGSVPQAVNVTLLPGNKLEGTVTDGQGEAAAGATVYVDTWRGARTLNNRIKVDAEGHFVWNDAPADEVKVDVLTNHGEKRGVVMKAGDDNKVALTPPTPFKGTVVDAQTGIPVTAYKVVLGIGFDEKQPISWEMGDSGSREVHQDGGAFDVLLSYPYPTRAVRVIADGYLPSDSTRFPMEGKEVAFTFKLEKGTPIHGTVLGVDGKPAAGVPVIMVTGGNNTQVQNGKLQEWTLRNALSAMTAADGTFTLPPQRDAYALAVVTDAGAAESSKAAFEKDPTLKVQAWGHVDGVIHHGTKAIAKAHITGQHQDDAREMDNHNPRIYFFYDGTSDDAGKFSFDRVYPGTLTISQQIMVNEHMGINSESATATVDSGKTTAIALGGAGRPIKGRVQIPADIASGGYQFGFNRLMPVENSSLHHVPLEAYVLPAKERQAWYKKWSDSDEGKAVLAQDSKLARRMVSRSIDVKPEGTFEVFDVPEGTYDVQISMTTPDPDNRWNGKPLGNFHARVVVPAIPDGVSDEPIDVGTLTMTKPFTGAVGEEQPEVTAKTSAGEPWSLAKQRGKYVLLYLFTTTDDEAASHLSQFQAVQDAYGKDPRFAMVGLHVGSDPAVVAKYAAEHHIAWTIAYAEYNDTLSLLQRLGEKGLPIAWIVDPDGKLAAKDLAPDTMQAELAKLLKK